MVVPFGGSLPTPLEAEIQFLLLKGDSPADIARDLLRRWNKNILSLPEQDDVACFLLNAGLDSEFFRQIERLCENGGDLPWGALAEAIGRRQPQPTSALLRSLFVGATEQNRTENLLRSKQLDLHSTEFAEQRQLLAEQRAAELETRKRDLREKLEFLRAKGLYEQEAKILDEIQALFPEEIEFRLDREAFAIRKAREAISKAASDYSLPFERTNRFEELTPELRAIKDQIVRQAKQWAAKHTLSARDLALALHFMEFDHEALEVLEFASPSPPVDWIRLELMIQARQFVAALHESTRLELLYADDAEAAFAASFARARALHGLGESSAAVELLREIVRLRPQYKSAHSLLMQWSGDDL